MSAFLAARVALAGLCIAASTATCFAQQDGLNALKANANAFEARYGDPSLDTIIIDDRGAGLPELQGLRNLRMVLPGILYRAGGNNVYRKDKLPNQGPLPPEALTNLCEQGFVQAIYLYRTGYEAKTIKCDYKGQSHEFLYSRILIDGNKAREVQLLRLVCEQIVSDRPYPILVHCFNGYHDSGYAAAIALRQFCGFDADQAYRCWEKSAAPGVSFSAMRARIKRFEPTPELASSTAQQKTLCSASARSYPSGAPRGVL